MLLKAEFLAIVLVLVYVGAVMVLFLFVVMMLDINLDKMREGFWGYFPLAATIGVDHRSGNGCGPVAQLLGAGSASA
jgi:NADH-quinone oxidoreductase subunit J